MIEIKFRAYDTYTKKMIFTGFHLFGEVLSFNCLDEWCYENPNPKLTSQMLRCNDIKITQFTGLPDKNGKDVYAGDILDGNIGKHIVRFGEFDNKKDYADHSDGVGFYLERDGKCNYSLNSSLIRIYNLEVVGNIYESPNLLK